jgi:hypothetical protein
LVALGKLSLGLGIAKTMGCAGQTLPRSHGSIVSKQSFGILFCTLFRMWGELGVAGCCGGALRFTAGNADLGWIVHEDK